jgi:hypothetical protein
MIQSMWHVSGSNAAHIRELAVFFGILLCAIIAPAFGLDGSQAPNRS